MSKIDLTTYDWREVVFQGKNKEYGAYVMRSDSDKRHNIAMLIIALVAVVGFSLPKLIELATPKQKEVMVDVTELSNIKKKAEVKQELKRPVTDEPPPAVKSSVKFTAPVIKKDEEVKEEDEIKSQDDLNKTDLAISIADVKGNSDAGELIEDIKEAVTEVVEEKPFDVVEQMPTFPGGDAELFKFLSENIRYPVIAQENGVQGRVIVRFVVTRKGDVDRIEVVRSVESSLDKEAIRIVKSMPKWIPGRQNGESVSVWFTLPINFKLQN